MKKLNNDIDVAREKIVELILRYDLYEGRSQEWRLANGVRMNNNYGSSKWQRYPTVKLFFYYENCLNKELSESLFFSYKYNEEVSRKLKAILRHHKKLKCVTSKAICCNSSIDYLRFNHKVDMFGVYCLRCGVRHEISEDEKALLMRLPKGSVQRILRLRSPAFMIWESR